MRYPQTFIDDLRRQADIVRVVQDYVALKKKGSNWMACCPFHKEKTPSFSVSPSKEIFYCFGCHKGGSVFNFVMEMERVSFPEAVKIIAEKSGIPLPKLQEDPRFEARQNERDEIIQQNTWALEWWQEHLETSAEAGFARQYLEQRQIEPDTQKLFRLGYCPDSWDALTFFLKRKGASQAQIERSGLVVKREEDGRIYDRFRGRLIFPVMDVQGRPIAFGARALKPDDTAKYINSPETAAYVKGRNLFGLNLTRDEIRRQEYAILVEGYLDLMIPYQQGIRNVVASLGTALTLEQVKLLGRFARKVLVNYDGDRAGVQAAKRAIEILLAEDFEVKVLVLPDNLDPDEFIRKFGGIEYQRRRGEALPHIQFVIDQAVRDRKLSNPAEKEAAINEVLPYVRAVRSKLQKREYFEIAMDTLRVGDQGLRRELWYSVRGGLAAGGSFEPRRVFDKPTVAEERLLELLFADKHVRQVILPRLSPEDYEELPTTDLFRAIISLDAAGTEPTFESVNALIPAESQATELLPMLLISEAPEAVEVDERVLLAERCISTLRLMKVCRRIDEVKAELADAQRANDEQEVAKLANEQIELERLKIALLPSAEVLQMVS
jgi:DNA primase